MICRFCASIIAVGESTCPQCGAPQPRQPDPPAAPAPGPRHQETRRPSPTSQHTQPGWRPPWQEVPAAQASAAMYYDARRSIFWMPASPQIVKPRSYRWKVCFVAALYMFLFFPGLIANIIWWLEARNLERSTGIAPAGKGCLTFMLVLAGVFLAFSLIVVTLA